jgi:acetyltransferase-like isoleucine patch superfamily enzyme
MRGFRSVVADAVDIGDAVTIAPNASIRADAVVLGTGVVIDEDVVIGGDRVEIAAGSRIGRGTRIVAPDIRLGLRSVIGERVSAELNERFQLGVQADFGHDVRIIGQTFAAGDHLWLTDGVLIGGGGARGPRSVCTIGDRSAIMERCFINVSEPVSIGDDTALSNGVTVLTHSLWHPALLGGTVVFAPTAIGDRNILYVNAVIAPGVTTGNDVTVGAGALVLHDVPGGSTAVGNPARIMKATPPVPRELDETKRDELLREVLRSYAETLPIKGVTVTGTDDRDTVSAFFDGQPVLIRYLRASGRGDSADITLAFGSGAALAGRCHFDLSAGTMAGQPTPLAEDLRDHLRRRTIRIFTDRPFRPLPPANLARLRERLRQS